MFQDNYSQKYIPSLTQPDLNISQLSKLGSQSVLLHSPYQKLDLRYIHNDYSGNYYGSVKNRKNYNYIPHPVGVYVNGHMYPTSKLNYGSSKFNNDDLNGFRHKKLESYVNSQNFNPNYQREDYEYQIEDPVRNQNQLCSPTVNCIQFGDIDYFQGQNKYQGYYGQNKDHYYDNQPDNYQNRRRYQQVQANGRVRKINMSDKEEQEHYQMHQKMGKVYTLQSIHDKKKAEQDKKLDNILHRIDQLDKNIHLQQNGSQLQQNKQQLQNDYYDVFKEKNEKEKKNHQVYVPEIRTKKKKSTKNLLDALYLTEESEK